ncbi:mandelate racemase/muconate lactonizing [Arthrobacter sp. Hiyo6]|nr:mandelate racemase/muconate lactonizing [Arthrobacter sp. Hiyo6]
MLSEVAPILIGQEVSPRALWDKAWKYLRFNGTGGITTLALAGLDIAYWDIMGKTANMSLVDMLGRFRDKTPLYGSGINLHLSIEDVIDQVEGWKLMVSPQVRSKSESQTWRRTCTVWPNSARRSAPFR